MANNEIKIVDPYVGEVYGNILDQYANPVYNLKLYMVRNIETMPDEYGKVDDLEDFNPADIVVLAQTGVTGTSIDDFVIKQVGSANNMFPTEFNFTIKQPGAASFLDQIVLAKAYLGLAPSAQPLVYIDVTFKGYTADILDEDAGGEIATISGPYRYKMAMTDIGVSINEAGSEYNIKAIPQSTMGYNHTAFQLPQTIKTVGKTVSEHLLDLEEQLNRWHIDKSKAGHTFKFDLSQLIGVDSEAGGGDSLEIIKDESLLTSKDGKAEDVNRIFNDLWSAKDNIAREQQLGDTPKFSGDQTEKLFDEDQLMHDKGSSLDRVLLTILSMCPEFYTKISRKTDISDPASEVNPAQAFVSWFRILSNVDLGAYDEDRNANAKNYTYTPILYKTARPDVGIDEKELEVDEEQIQGRIAQIKQNNSLYKAYNYLFTGLNDQILGLDIKYDFKVPILMPPKGGAFGDISVVASTQVSNQVSAEKDISAQGLTQDLFNTQSDQKLVDKISNLLSFDSFVDGIQNQLGVSVDELKEKVGNDVNKVAGALSAAIDTRSITSGQVNLDINSTTPVRPTENSETTTGIDDIDYTPQLSGIVYSPDILNPATTDETIAADLLEKGYVAVSTTEVEASANKAINQEVDRTQDVPNKAQGATYKAGSTQNKLFGYLVNQQYADRFLIEIDMTVRGDPWYLGRSDTNKSSPTQANYLRGENCFWLEIRSPITYDPDTEDEDSNLNSGYWKYEGVSQTFSALYIMREIECTFSGGSFSVDIKAFQNSKYNASVVEKKQTATTVDTLLGPVSEPLSTTDRFADPLNASNILDGVTARPPTEDPTSSNNGLPTDFDPSDIGGA